MVDSFCHSAKPISWSAKDTDQTIREVKTHNAVYAGLCPSGDGPSPLFKKQPRKAPTR